MAKKQINQGPPVVIKQFRLALNYSQEALARDWACSSGKIWRAENGTEPTFTAKDVKLIEKWLQEKFGKTWQDLPDSLLSDEPIPFLQPLIEKNQNIQPLS